MLAEWFTYLTTDCPLIARQFGYLRESIGIRARHRRCSAAWRPHLDKSKAALLQSLQSCDDFRTALVFGSGLLLDIPLAQLAERFREVWLVDLVHLPEVQREARRHANVRCLSHDVSECLERLRTGLSNDLDTLPESRPSRFLDEKTVDWVASVNLLSQLPLLPLEWLQRRFPEVREEQLARWGEGLMRRHLDYLDAFDAPVCLLADAEQTSYGADGAIIEHVDFAAKFDLDRLAFEQWRWDVAPPGEIAPGVGRFHRVVACSRGRKSL